MSTDAADWHLRDWMAHFNKKQAALVNELGWNKSKAHFVWHSRNEYRRELVNEVATWLNLQPYELLMPPQEALALRHLREMAAQIVASGPPTPAADPGPAKKPEPRRRIAAKR